MATKSPSPFRDYDSEAPLQISYTHGVWDMVRCRGSSDGHRSARGYCQKLYEKYEEGESVYENGDPAFALRGYGGQARTDNELNIEYRTRNIE